mmetsp:Transcript_23706/g.37864  ORF Transcript_23706/g.37864 Transcript_23706/m.37864 type:complete len:414 (-) Transcript_23706:2276-3517(-)
MVEVDDGVVLASDGMDGESGVAGLRARMMHAQMRRREAEAEMARLAKVVSEMVAEEQRLEEAIRHLQEGDGLLDDQSGEEQLGEQEENQEETAEEAAARLQAEKIERERVIQEQLELQKEAVAQGSVVGRAKGLRFLKSGDSRSELENRVALASYPRSGNSLLRSLIERLTGVFTGSDGDPRRELNKQLVEKGMYGEGIVDDSVFAIKTHFPERVGRCAFKVGRGIVIVRNPFDAMVSYFNMILTQTHTLTIKDDEFKKYAEIWDHFVREEIGIWKEFHEHWLSRVLNQKIPVLLVRYEDLLEHRSVTFERIAKFVLKVDTLDGSGFENVVKEICADDHRNLGVYVPRSGPGHVGSDNADCQKVALEHERDDYLPLSSKSIKNLKHFTEEQKKFVLGSCKSELSSLGYWASFF